MYKLLGLLFVSTALSACGSVYKSANVTRVTEDGRTEVVSEVESYEKGFIKAFPDIPIPSTHRINLAKSVIYTSPSVTMAKVTLSGGGDLDSLYRFFEENMAANDWTMVNAVQSSQSFMHYAKPGRFTSIFIENLGKYGNQVHMTVGPE